MGNDNVNVNKAAYVEVTGAKTTLSF